MTCVAPEATTFPYTTLFRSAYRVCGSSDLYGWAGKTPTASINFVTSHDGFPLRDLASFNDKHNEANGEDNKDRSEEHTSELQSLRHLVCRLLLEKKRMNSTY